MEDEVKFNKKDVGKTLKQWLRKGCIPKRGRKGELRYASRASYRKGENPAVYFDPNDVVENFESARERLAEMLQNEEPWFNFKGKTLKQWVEAGYIPKRGKNGHLRYSSPHNQDEERYLYFDPEEVRKGSLDESAHARKVWHNEVNRRWNTTGKTLLQWAELGFIPKRNAKPEERFCNYYHYKNSTKMAEYYDPDQVIENKAKAAELMNAVKEKRRLKAKKAKAKERECAKRVRRRWEELINGGNVVIFDTETSGVDPEGNDILSISWILADANFNAIKTETRYFDWTEDERRVSKDAIAVNGLTRERLAELGVCDRKEAMEEFIGELERAVMLIAHNIDFDYSFVKKTAIRYGLSTEKLDAPYRFCTMKELTYYCRIMRYDGSYKWPSLSEAAAKLKVPTDDIDWHTSASDTEVVRRLMVEIVRKSIVGP